MALSVFNGSLNWGKTRRHHGFGPFPRRKETEQKSTSDAVQTRQTNSGIIFHTTSEKTSHCSIPKVTRTDDVVQIEENLCHRHASHPEPMFRNGEELLLSR
jgi:hypothetical protein